MEHLGAKIIFPVEEAVKGVDVIYLLRIQKKGRKLVIFPVFGNMLIFWLERKWLNKGKWWAIYYASWTAESGGRDWL